MGNLITSLWLLLSANFTQVGDSNANFNVHLATLKPQLLYASYYYQETDDDEITNIAVNFRQKPFAWLETNQRYLNIDGSEILHLDGRYCAFSGWKEVSLGVAQQWRDEIPTTKVVLGKSYSFSTKKNNPSNKWEEALNVLSSMTIPMTIEFSADMLTDDFKDYDTDIRTNFTLQILANIGLYTMAEVRNYNQSDTIITLGLKLNM